MSLTLGTSSPRTPVAQPFALCKDPSQEEGKNWPISLVGFFSNLKLGAEFPGALVLLVEMNLPADCSSSCNQAWKVLKILRSWRYKRWVFK